MGTTLANLHIWGGALEEIKALLPDAVIGVWSSHGISVFDGGFLPQLVDKTARTLSKKVPQPVLSAWLFDSDAVGLAVFQNGKRAAAHILNPEGYSKMGNIPLFCEVLGLPAEDVPRLRAVWKKGNAEERLWFTGALLGLPLYHDSKELPDRIYERDTDGADQWIKERPRPPKIKNQAKAELIQEIPQFRYHGPGLWDAGVYAGVEPYDDRYAFERTRLWQAGPDGTIHEVWSADRHLSVCAFRDRVVCTDFLGKEVLYDSAGLLPKGYPASGGLRFLGDGGFLKTEAGPDEEQTLICCAPNGEELWRKEGLSCRHQAFCRNDRELILAKAPKERFELVRIDLSDGHEIGTVDRPVGLNAYQKVWHNGFWWVSHDGLMPENGVWQGKGKFGLAKLDEDLRVVGEVHLPLYTQRLFFSPDGKLAYVFIFEDQVMVIDTERLTVEWVLEDKSYFSPLGFDRTAPEPRFWLQRGGSTVELRDELLLRPRSRHRLKGEIVGYHRDETDALCVAAIDEKKKIFRIYRLS